MTSNTTVPAFIRLAKTSDLPALVSLSRRAWNEQRTDGSIVITGEMNSLFTSYWQEKLAKSEHPSRGTTVLLAFDRTMRLVEPSQPGIERTGPMALVGVAMHSEGVTKTFVVPEARNMGTGKTIKDMVETLRPDATPASISERRQRQDTLRHLGRSGWASGISSLII